MRKLTAAAIIAATAAALAYRPSRETLGDLLITLGGHMAYGEPPPRTPASIARGEARLVAAAMEQQHRHRANGHDGPI